MARREQCVDDGPCAPSEVFTVRGGRTRSLGRAHTIRPDVDGRTVWLTRYPGTSAAEGRWLERRTYDGALVGPRTRLRPYEDVEAVGQDGPVLGGEEAVVTLLRADSRTRVPVLDHGRILGMVGRLVLWAEMSCDVDGREPCAISTTEPGTGITAEVVSLGDRFPAHAAVDPSGEHVAVATSDAAEQVEVVSYYVSTGRAEPVGAFPVSLDIADLVARRAVARADAQGVRRRALRRAPHRGVGAGGRDGPRGGDVPERVGRSVGGRARALVSLAMNSPHDAARCAPAAAGTPR